jgi:L-asparagine transporter-like permease
MRSAGAPVPRRDPVIGDQPPADTDEWNRSVRGEHPQQRADRNFIELLQELRVMQTGVQILFALLLTVSFTSAFADADGFQRTVYVITLVCCAVATALFTAPVAFHRRLFQRDRKAEVVQVAHRLLQAGMLVLLVAVVGALLLVLDEAVSRVTGLLVSSLVGVVFALLWFVLPAWSASARRGANRSGDPDESSPGEVSSER